MIYCFLGERISSFSERFVNMKKEERDGALPFSADRGGRTLHEIQRAAGFAFCVGVGVHGGVAFDVDQCSVLRARLAIVTSLHVSSPPSHLILTLSYPSPSPYSPTLLPPSPLSAPKDDEQEAHTYPFSNPAIKSLCGPSSAKLVTRNQLVVWLSLGPLFTPTAYLKISRPVLVGVSSGVSARRPMMVIFAKDEREVDVVKARASEGALRRRERLIDISVRESMVRWWT